MKAKMVSFEETKRELFENSKVKEAYEVLGPEFAVIEQIIKARIEKGVSQKQLAKKMGTSQSAIARLEGGKANPSLAFLKRLARALDSRLEIHFLK